jgi:hypothetical protein
LGRESDAPGELLKPKEIWFKLPNYQFWQLLNSKKGETRSERRTALAKREGEAAKRCRALEELGA